MLFLIFAWAYASWLHAQGSWVSIGPGGGDVNVIASSPTGLLAGFRGFGGFIYVNDGQDWRWFSEGLSSAVVPRDFASDAKGNLYMGANTVYRRAPSNIWASFDKGLPPPRLTSIAALIADLDDNLYAVSKSPGGTRVYKLPEGSDTWIQFHDGLPTNWGNSNHQFTVDTNGHVYLSAPNPYVVRLLRGTTTWTGIADGLPPGLGPLAADDKGNVYMGNQRGVFKLPLDGDRWIPHGSSLDRVSALAIDKANNLYAGVGNRYESDEAAVFKFDSNGNWENLQIPSRAKISRFTTDANTLYVANELGVFRFRDGLWDEYNQGLNGAHNFRLISDANGNLYTITLFGEILFPPSREATLVSLSPGSTTWQYEAPRTCCGLAADSLGNVFSVGIEDRVYLKAYRRNSNGEWSDISTGLLEQQPNLRPFQVSVAANDTVYTLIVNDTSEIVMPYKLAPGSTAAWQALPIIIHDAPNINRASVAADRKGNIYAHIGSGPPFMGYRSRTYVLRVGTDVWEQLDPDSIYWMTTLGGFLLYEPHLPFDHLALDATDTLFIAGGVSVYKLNENERWVPYSQGLPQDRTMSLKSDAAGNLFLTMQYEGLYVLPQGGDTWIPFPSTGLEPLPWLWTSAVNPQGGVFAATAGYSVLAYKP